MPSQPRAQACLKMVRAVAVKMLVEGDSVAGVAEKIGEHGLALLERLLAKVLAVEFDQVEGAEHGGMVVMPIAEEVEHREARLIDDDRLAIDDAGAHRQAATARAIFGNRAVKSLPLRVNSRTRSLSRRARMRKPSCLIS